jgi:amino acid transporter
MASTSINVPGAAPPAYQKAVPGSDEEKKVVMHEETASIGVGDHTHRKLKSRHIQLIGNPPPPFALSTSH